MELEEAKQSFTMLLYSVQDSEKEHFLNWIQDCYIGNGYNNLIPTQNGRTVSAEERKKERKADIMLSCIKESLREKVPFNGVMESEEVSFPVVGSDIDLNSKNCVHVDAFLYDEEDVELLVQSGKLSNNYCKDCFSSNIQPVTFISHSASKDRLRHIFKNCLPSLNDKVILDVGSRLGVVLYAAYVYTEARRIIGIEINHELCNVQKYVIDKYKLSDRIDIYEGDIMDMSDKLKEANIIVLMNVFEWFLQLDDQLEVWNYLHQNITSGTFIVASPPIEISLELIGSKIDFDYWLKEIHFGRVSEEFCEETEFKIYRVL